MKIVLIGSGNVASQLGVALKQSGQIILQVYSRQVKHANGLAERLGCDAIDKFSSLTLHADLYLICVSDQAIEEIILQLPKGLSGVVAHTSGSTALSIFSESGHPGRYGVFYPVQTFSKAKAVDFKTIPLALEASDPETYTVLSGLAEMLSEQVFPCDSKQREAIHIAAVFACNFSNYLYSVADLILQQHGLSFDLMRPLILETAKKAQHFAPATVQTGPAVRKDLKIVKQHLEFLEREQPFDPRIRQLYALISEILAGK